MHRLSLLVDLATMLSRHVDLDALLEAVCERLARALDAERATLWLVDAEHQELFTKVALLPEVPELRQPLDRGLSGHVVRSATPLRLDDARRDPRFDPSADRATGFNTRSVLSVPVLDPSDGGVLGAIQVLNRRAGPFDADDERYLVALAAQFAQGLSLTTLRRAPGADGVLRRGQFNHVIGRSSVMRSVYERLSRVAGTDASVLLLGETGTGKTLLARTLHENSTRQGGPFVTLDCTTLPTQLVESELFGHERGAFTGADRRVRGKVELAQHGTLFLDEIAELSLEAQAKLLRLLQERRFERVGGRETQHADVRIVTATHKRLEREVQAGRFREDLYYRVRVVEIAVPPLRARGGEEIEQLITHFAETFSQRYRLPKPVFTERALHALRTHAWPGNVRELEHFIESQVVLANEGLVEEIALERQVESAACEPSPSEGQALVRLPLGLSLAEATRRYVEHTVRALDHNRSRAAVALGIGRNTVTRMLNPLAPPK
ncbi:MAG: sigma-54-dependent Fis family transcriptional regulator [Myxococcales bacterium]